MKKMTQSLILFLALLVMGYSASLRAEDVDIYVDNAGTAGTPNVLFVIDNGANFSANAKVGCSFYSGTTEVPSLGNDTAAGIEQCALVEAIKGLPDDSMNIGILVTNATNFATDVRLSTDAAYHELCTGDKGGCLLRKLTKMSAGEKERMIKFVKSWTKAGSNSADAFNIKVNSALPGTMMQEAWAYYNGKIGMSGKDYVNSVLAGGCQKNFIIYIANAEKTPAAENPLPNNTTDGLGSTQANATTAQKTKISETVTFKPAVCGATSVPPGTQSSDWSENWADEWARLMFEKDGGAADAENVQNIITYTVGVVNEETCTADYPALLATMAKYGGGEFYKTSTAVDLLEAIKKILNEVQAVNSVFSSASLPVSVNSEGTYLNQIYLGMFRPDSSGSPRWMGNLKQYQAIKTKTGELVMGDATGQPAISSAGTGFISPNAISFWSKKDTSTAPDSSGGFFKNQLKGVPLSGYDSPDGEVVEKGGVAQQLRLESLTADYSTQAGTSTNPRRLYTYCPAGGTCTAALTDISNEFSTTNALISATSFGESSSIPVASIKRTGTTAVVTTTGNHGYATNATVTITNAGQPEYNVTQAVTVTGSTTFTITNLPDYPTTPSQGAYKVGVLGVDPISVLSITRATSTTGGKNSEVATVSTSAPHGYTTTSTIAITGASPSAFSFTGSPASVPSDSSFTFSVAIEPATPAANVYSVALSPTAHPALAGVSLTNPAQGSISGSTASAHKLHAGQTVTISGASDSTNSKYNGTYTLATVTTTTFTITGAGTNVKNLSGATATVTPDFSAKAISTLTRAATTSPAVATATGLTANAFGAAVGDTKTVNITKSSGSAANESAYVGNNVVITCLSAGCTSFTYPIVVTPSVSATGTITVAVSGASVTVPAGSITRTSGDSTATATVTGIPALSFTDGETLTIGAADEARSSESAYVGTWKIKCVDGSCTSFTFGPVPLTPSSPATGSNIQAFSGSTPPDKNTIINWLRGSDNYGDEKGPGGSVTVRPSIHGDVLHSRPLVVNYGDSRGIVVFYGSNDGVFRAVNGNQTAAIGTVPAGGELWGLILPEHYGHINRLRMASPELKFPASTLATAQPKNYFVDGPTGSYQKLAAGGKTIEKSYLYLTMRRGGRFIYAVDVSQPTAPTVLWRIDTTKTGFEELGQTWSRPRVTVLETEASSTTTTPVLIFGGGYDTAEDSEPPGANTMGRAVYITNALTGELIWSATASCTTSTTCLNVPGMTHAIPSEIAFVDRNNNGYTDKLYFGDTGGNVWRIDVKTATTNWAVTKVAALGCSTGSCPTTSPATTPRKFFFPPSVLTIKEGTGAYDAISLVSGDREHPLKNTAVGSSYNVSDKYFMVMDKGTTVGGTATTGVTPLTMFDATSANTTTTAQFSTSSSYSGFYITFATGEKGVNAPLALSGSVFFGTNRPVDRSKTCAANLGEAKAYAVNPFLGTQASNILAGGGLAPSAVTGLITVDGSTERFCIGCGISTPPDSPPDDPPPPPCNSALEICTPSTEVPKNLKRTYWYKK